MIKFPYGISDFHIIRNEDYFYVDRTSHIRLIEDAGLQLLFLRPRRFGKSLLISMLENYYDIAKADEFEKLFGDLAIGKNPTPRHNKYFVMKWDFSNVSPQGDAKDIREALYTYINQRIQKFYQNYQAWLSIEIEIHPTNAQASFQSLLTAVQLSKFRLYLLIDEYDNFANEVMMGQGNISKSRYNALLSSEGWLKALFKSIKSAASGEGLERVFLTGATPILLSDMTSSYNVAENIYFYPAFNDLCGFRESELKSIVNQIVTNCKLSPEKAQTALKLMQSFYNGYSFGEGANELIYNPTLVIYFLKYFQQNCQFPRRMLDDNLTMDLNKLSYLSRLPNGRAIIKQALNGKPPLVLSLLASRFGLEEMLKTDQSSQFIISLLYYLGILTLNGQTSLRRLRFKIPNLVIRKLYVEHLFEMLLPKNIEREEIRLLAEEFYETGDLQAVCDFMELRYFKVFDNRDYKGANELTIKTAFLTVLFDDVFYIMDSETPSDRRYVDLTMIVRPDFRNTELKNFLIEFKFLKLKDVNLSGKELKAKSSTELEALEAVQENIAEAKQQLLDYQKPLEAKYAGEVKLDLICVVAIGFERVVWKML